MSTLYDFLNPDGSEVEEQRLISAPGATTGDVLTVNADKTVSPAPGGSQPVQKALFAGSGESCTSGENTLLPWTLSSGDAVLDLASPVFPLATVEGLYTVSVLVDLSAGSSHAGKTAQVQMSMTSLTMKGQARLDPDIFGDAGCWIPLTASYVLEVGQGIAVAVFHEVGSAITAAVSAAVVVQPS